MRAILWDLNGVLIDDERLQQQCWQQTLQETGVELEANWWETILGRKTRVSLKEISPTWSEERIENLIKRTRGLYGKRLQEINPGPGVQEMLKVAEEKGLKQAVVTGASPEDIAQALRVHRFDAYMQLIISGSQIKESKPSPEGYLKACKELGVAPEECWVIEDSPAGVQAGKAAGCYCLGLTTTMRPEALQKADLVAGGLSGEMLEQMSRLSRS